MFRISVGIAICLVLFSCGQPKQLTVPLTKSTVKSDRSSYQATYTSYFDLIHTKLELKPIWKEHTMEGIATLILKPHFYPADSIVLDARGMIIKRAGILKNNQFVPLLYRYNSLQLTIQFDTIYSAAETIALQIEYLAQPETIKQEGSASIKSNRGLFFINPDSSNKTKPTQLWTQGETESNSGWFPTIESPSQRMTQEIYLTVDTSFTTVSNGLLLSSNRNIDGTRTDYWKQSLPAAPYLTMIAVGDFAKTTDRWHNLEVSYYVDPLYEKYSRLIFGHTPEMLEFYSSILGVKYPWEKYSQIVVHDYISGAMENTTAVIHGTNMQQDSREYGDYNYEHYIAHELFHHWFGDLVTCESWSNITLNEGFATYGEYLWNEYKFGREEADYYNSRELLGYLNFAKQKDAPLIRTQFIHREEMYDPISYNKGGLVLHMLRKYTGDKAFFASLKLYLTKHAYHAVELADLRIAFEEITGEDLNWFFNQWFLQAGYPNLDISHSWSEENKTETILIKQHSNKIENEPYKLPMTIDFYNGKLIRKEKIILDKNEQTFNFTFPTKPDLVNVDAEKMLLCKKTDSKSNSEWRFQLEHAPLYLDRYEAFKFLADSDATTESTAKLIATALDDKYWNIRNLALNSISEIAKNNPAKIKEKLISLAQKDPKSTVRENALRALGKYYPYEEMKPIFEKALTDESYDVEGAALNIIYLKEPNYAAVLAPTLEKDTGSGVYTALSEVYKGNSNSYPFFKRALKFAKGGDKIEVVRNFQFYLSNKSDPEEIESGFILLVENRKSTNSRWAKSEYLKNMNALIENIKEKVAKLEVASKKESDQQSAQKSELNTLLALVTRLNALIPVK